MAIFKKVVLGNNTYLHVEMIPSKKRLYKARFTKLVGRRLYYERPEKDFNSLEEFIMYCQLVNPEKNET